MSGKIKGYTKHYNFIIPEFNVATWHDYIEENFRSIDALFQNLFGINNFSGMWKTNAEYKANQVLFVGEDNGSLYEGRLVKITQDTNTAGFATFSEAIDRYPTHYEMFADANSAEIFANLSKDWATYLGSTVKTPTGEDTGEYSAKHHAQVAGSHEEACEMYRNLAKTDSDLAKESETHATEQAQIAQTQATDAATSATNAKTSENSAQSYANSSKHFSEASEQSAKDSEYYALISSPPPLLSHIWSDHILNDIRFLRADTFSWQDADVYDAVYGHLLEDYKNLSAETETVGSYTITFYRAEDGHKIVLPDMEETVKNIYNNTGVAWYYILDVENRRFKLPRTKWGVVGVRNGVGNYVPETLPDHSHYMDSKDVSGSGGTAGTGWTSGTAKKTSQASTSNSTYQNGAPVQQRATQMYLYFYVGNYTKSAIEQTAGLNTELLNNKVDIDAAVLNSGDQVISGSKKFAQTIGVKGHYNYGTPPAADSYSGTAIFDENNDNIGADEFLYRANGSCVRQLIVKRQDKTSNYAKFGVGFDKNKNEAVEASTGVKQTIVGWGMPDYSAGVSVSSGFVCPSDGYIRVYAYDNGNIDYAISNSSGTVNFKVGANSATSQNGACFAQVEKGFILTQQRKSGNSSIMFYPMKGAQ